MTLLLLLGCAPRVAVGGGITDDVPKPAAYEATIREATRELRLYEEIVHVLLVKALYLSPGVRAAMGRMRAHLLLLDTVEVAAEPAHEVLFTAASEHRDDLAFGLADEAPWRVRAFVDGRPCTPDTVTRVPITAMDRALLPWLTEWDTLWRARFATDCGAEGLFELQLTGPHGAGELGWRL